MKLWDAINLAAAGYAAYQMVTYPDERQGLNLALNAVTILWAGRSFLPKSMVR